MSRDLSTRTMSSRSKETQKKPDYIYQEFRIRYDHKQDVVRITGNAAHPDFLMTVKKGTSADVILREELKENGLIRPEHEQAPTIDIVHSIVTGFGGSYLVSGRIGSGKSVLAQAAINSAKIAGIPVHTFLEFIYDDDGSSLDRLRAITDVMESGEVGRSLVVIDLDKVVPIASSYDNWVACIRRILDSRIGSGASIILISLAAEKLSNKNMIDTLIHFDTNAESIEREGIVSAIYNMSNDGVNTKLKSLRSFEYLVNYLGSVVVGKTVTDGIVDLKKKY